MIIFQTLHRWSRRYIAPLAFIVVILGTLVLPQSAVVQALTPDQIQTLQSGVRYFNTEAGSACATTTSALVGSDNEQQAYNFFTGQGGFNAVQASAIIGNLMDESHMDPTILQKGGDSQNPNDAGTNPNNDGWGIAQWSPGGKIIGIAQSLNITTPIYELGTQLNIVLAEMNGIAPTGYKDVSTGLKQQTDLPSAVTFFQVHFESGDPGKRQQFANEAFVKYGGSTTTTPVSDTTTPSTGCGANNGLSPDCQAASGVAKILCDAKKYDTVSYSETGAGGHQGGAAWHKACPVIGPSCILDCSGLVNIAVFDVYGADLQQNTFSEASDTKDWQHIPLSEVQAGDLLQPNTGHVVIIDHVTGNTIFGFAAQTAKLPQPQQVGPENEPVSSGNVYLHYIGQGSNT